MGKVYITGHRNPDLDSLCAASAYANLKNLTDSENEYIAIHRTSTSPSTAALYPIRSGSRWK